MWYIMLDSTTEYSDGWQDRNDETALGRSIPGDKPRWAIETTFPTSSTADSQTSSWSLLAHRWLALGVDRTKGRIHLNPALRSCYSALIVAGRK